ncbi:MAG: zinc-binding alcohol dehydrogenase [Rhodanobacter sp.]|nr:MAG: zinc-binding alcohol dehydrogenase [Rhodanobacter sp.]TAM10037.1 MAG: zinc-binding alcohol dehydrogenase [Rhodanobacter sp.]TAM34733.1 MAG: zinc-binding alcohol dehydrogenase [Rhodanobacter sp.]
MNSAKQVARAYWLSAPGTGEIRTEVLPACGTDEVLVHTRFSGVSRGTESLVFRGGVPADQYAAMRAPFQQGDFPGPIKYGYLSVGTVEQGPSALCGKPVFCLYPHQDRYVVPASAVVPAPEGVPLRRAVLAGMLETAVNAVWDVPPLVGDRIAIVGAGVVGCCVARLAANTPGADVTLVDVDPSRAAVAQALGVGFALPTDAPHECDVVFHASASSAGLQLALDLLGFEGRVVELSWYGNHTVELALGGAFHSRRLGIVASQVSQVAPARRGHRSLHQRLALALEILRDPAFDVLLTGTSRFDELPAVMPRLADRSLPALCHVIAYP